MALVNVYLHSDKEYMHDVGKKLGLKGVAHSKFVYACYEVKIGLDVDMDSGNVRIVTVDDRKLQD